MALAYPFLALDGLLECVINVSEGRDDVALDRLRAASGPALVDVHFDPDHHRSVFTLAGPGQVVEDAARRLADEAVSSLDLESHVGAHPRLGTLDVVPFIALDSAGVDADFIDGALWRAVAARERFATWAGQSLELPCFLYGPERTLPDLRRQAWTKILPEVGPTRPHLRAGSVAVGARPLLVAYNLWLANPNLEVARTIATQLRNRHVRALGLLLGQEVQVSCNLVSPAVVGPESVFDAVAARVQVKRAELVGLLPRSVLRRIPPGRWEELGLSESVTIESRLESASFRFTNDS